MISKCLDLLREFAFTEFSEDKYFGFLFGYYIRLLLTFNEEGQALHEIQTIIKLYEETDIINIDRYLVYCFAAEYYTGLEDLHGNIKVQSEELRRSRLPLYDSLFSQIERLFSKNSVEWVVNAIKKANYFMDLDCGFEMSQSVLTESISQVDLSQINLQEAKQIGQAIIDSYQLFDNSNSLTLLISFSEGLIRTCDLKVEEFPSLYKTLAQAKGSVFVGDYSGADDIYSMLSDYYNSIGDVDSSVYYDFKRAKELQKASLYKECLSLSIDIENRFLRESLHWPDGLKYWHLYSISQVISTCYYLIGNPVDCGIYARKASSYLHTSISQTEYSSPESYISDMRTLAESYHSIGNYEWEKAISTLLQLNDYISSSSMPDEEKKYQLMLSYGRLALYYVATYNLRSALNAIDNYRNSGGSALNSLRYSAQAYDRVAIEPEIALDYYNRYLDGLLKLDRKSATVQEFIVEKEFIRTTLERIRNTYEHLGTKEQVLSCFKKELEFTSDSYGKESDEYFDVYYHLLDYEKALAENENDFVESHRLADSLLQHVCRYGKLEEYYRELDYSYYSAGDMEKGRYYAEKELERLKGEEAYYDAELSLYRRYYSIEETERLLKDRIHRWNEEKDQFHYYQAVRDLASFYYFNQRYEEALEQFKYFIDHCRISELRDTVSMTYVELFQTASKAGASDGLASYYKEGSKVIKEFISSRIDDYGQSEKERETLLTTFSKAPFALGEAYLEDPTLEIDTETVYDNILYRKNALISLSISSINLIRSAGDTLLVKKYNRAQALKAGLANHDANTVYDYVTQSSIPRETAEKLVVRFDEEIAHRSSMLGDITQGLSFSWKDVQRHLKSRDVAIEFSRYEKGEKAYYAAFLLQAEGVPTFIPLFPESVFLGAVNAQNYYQDSSVYDLVWKPLEPYLTEKNNIYFSPDGILHNIAIESVPGVNPRLCLYRLSSTCYLVKNYYEGADQAVVYGGIQYDMDLSQMQTTGTIDGFNRDSSADLFFNSDGASRSGVSFLFGSQKEAEDITIQYSDNGIPCRAITGTDATETSFKSLNGQEIKTLHVATHGFYVPPQDSDAKDYDTLEGEALYRSGLLFAGANNYLRGKRIPQNIDDGILTAKEISELDLRNVDLAVLSACETGLGDITSSGVYGLQRGLKKAGVHSLLVSLWAVDDNATQLLMTHFYKNLISGMSKLTSLKEAQQYLKDYSITEEEVSEEPEVLNFIPQERKENEPKPVHPFEDPYFWAAFILIDGI